MLGTNMYGAIPHAFHTRHLGYVAGCLNGSVSAPGRPPSGVLRPHGAPKGRPCGAPSAAPAALKRRLPLSVTAGAAYHCLLHAGTWLLEYEVKGPRAKLRGGGRMGQIANGVANSNGLEGLRLLSSRYEPRTNATNRADLKAMISNPLAKRTEDMDSNLRRQKALAGHRRAAGLQEHLESASKDMKQREASTLI